MELEGEAARLARRAVTFRRLTGLEVGRFCALLEEFAPLMAAADRKRLNKRERQRKIGAGNAYDLPLCDRLLMTLMYYRTYIAQEFLGYLFDLDAANVCRNMARIRPVLAQIFRVPERRIKVDPEEVATLFLTGRNNGSTVPKAASNNAGSIPARKKPT